jgi:hypothetical protein
MTQYTQEQYYGQPAGDPHQPQGKTSAMAVASLVCSLICCFPVTTILGVLLGVFALVSISSNPAKRGKGLAIAGILLGIVFTAGQAFVGYNAYTSWQMFKRAPHQALEPGFRGDYASMRANFGPAGMAATDEDAQAFVEELRARYGELQGSEIDISQFQGMQPPPPGQSSVATLPWVLNFDQGSVDAELTFSGEDQVPGRDELIFRQITILDPALGDISFPPVTAPPMNGTDAAEDADEADSAAQPADGS